MSEHAQIVKLKQARQLLAECKTFDDAKHIYDIAEAARRYAVVSRLGQEAQNEATEIRLRAERLLGSMLVASPPRHTGRPGIISRSGSTNSGAPTLSEMGLTRDQSSQWQMMARIPDGDFEAFIETHRTSKDLTRSAILQMVRDNERQVRSEDQRHHAETVLSGDGSFVLSLDNLVASVASGEQEPFGCLYVDPPWAYSNQGTRASTNKHYPTMTVDEMATLPVGELAGPRSHLHLWTTNGFLFECPKLFAAWGFEFKSSFVWVKPQIGIGNYWRNAHEFLLLGVRGNQRALDLALPSWIEARRAEHSVKPDRVRSLIERLSPGPYLELFGRKQTEGWVVWGNECSPSTLNMFRRKAQ